MSKPFSELRAALPIIHRDRNGGKRGSVQTRKGHQVSMGIADRDHRRFAAPKHLVTNRVNRPLRILVFNRFFSLRGPWRKTKLPS
jgi:hypothetical protein